MQQPAPKQRASAQPAPPGETRKAHPYNLEALYSIVDAMALESSASGTVDGVPQRHASTSSTSSQRQFQRSSLVMSKLLEEPPEIRVQQASNGLLALPWPALQHPRDSPMALAHEQYALLVSQINVVEKSLDEALRKALTGP